MKKILFLLLPCLGISLLTNHAWANDADGNHAVWGIGQKSCIAYQENRDDPEQNIKYENFLMGFLTATNILMENTYSISGTLNLTEIMNWIGDYCEEQPMSSFEAAISSFSASNYKERLLRPGRQW